MAFEFIYKIRPVLKQNCKYSLMISNNPNPIKSGDKHDIPDP